MVVLDIKPFQDLYDTHGTAYDKGATIYREGEPGTRLHVVLEGKVVLTAGDGGRGRPKILRTAGAGDLFGEDGVLGAQGYGASARVLEPARVVSLDRDDLPACLREHPEAGVALLEAVLARLRDASSRAAAPPPPEPARPTITTAQGPLEYNEQWFYADKLTCPVCGAAFETLRVRSRAVNSVKRESDFHYLYRSVNPLHYAVTVCPSCYYAAYNDDFEAVPKDEAQAILAEADARRLEALDADLRGERDLDGVALSFRLALSCYELRKHDQRRHAGLLHRLAWVARERGDAEAERDLLGRALASYRQSFETDTSLSEDAIVTLGYLLGEISLRLGNYDEAVRWFSQVTRMPESKRHPEVLRLTRDRWADARELATKR